MGRELKRVPLDFYHPLHTLWPGYVRKQPAECHHCQGTGSSPHGQRLSNEWYGREQSTIDPRILAILGGKSSHPGEIGTFDPVAYGSTLYTRETPGLRDMIYNKFQHSIRCEIWRRQREGVVSEGEDVSEKLTEELAKNITDDDVDRELDRMIVIWNRSWSNHLIAEDVKALVDEGRLMDFTRRPRTPEQAAALEAEGGYWMKESNGHMPTPQEVNLWSLNGMGHDSINSWICIKARAEREGLNHCCEHCGGHGHVFANEAEKFDYDNWKRIDPPTGDGFQLWTTTNEGAPISPVFDTLEKLCDWCSEYASVFGDDGASKDEWMKMLGEDGLVGKEVKMPNGSTMFMM
jgi:hypothetical protein